MRPKTLRIVLVNPNASAATTAAMAAVAVEAAGDGVEIVALTAPRGPNLITTERDLAAAAAVVASMRDAIVALRPNAVLVAAFGDPGRAALQAALAPTPVVGIGEAAMLAASALGRYAIVTTTPDLMASIDLMNASGPWPERYAGTVLTPGDPALLMSRPDQLLEALELACRVAVDGSVRSVVIGGGPLGDRGARHPRARARPDRRAHPGSGAARDQRVEAGRPG